MSEDKVNPKSRDLDISILDEFSKIQVQKYGAERLKSLANEINEFGLLHPIVVRPNPAAEGRYEILGGHNRVEAYKLLGKNKIKATVYEGLSNDMAEGIFFSGNLTQQNFNDWSYSHKIKAIRHIDKLTKEESKQGKRPRRKKNEQSTEDSTSVHDGQKSAGTNTRKRMSSAYGIGESTLGNYRSIIKLNNETVDFLVAMMDADKMSFNVTYRISKLDEGEILTLIDYMKRHPDVVFKGKEHTENFKLLHQKSKESDRALTEQEILDLILAKRN